MKFRCYDDNDGGTNYLVLIEANNNMVMRMVILEILGLLKVNILLCSCYH